MWEEWGGGCGRSGEESGVEMWRALLMSLEHPPACPQTIAQLEKVEFIARVLDVLCSKSDILSSISGTSALCILGRSMCVWRWCGCVEMV